MDKKYIGELIIARLEQSRRDIAQQWAHPESEGTHTRHFYVDDLLPEPVARSIYDAFPRNAEGFFDRTSFRESKKTLTNLQTCAPILSAITYALQEPSVIDTVADIAQLSGLVPDPSLYAAGLSMMFKEDFLNPHIDNSHDGSRALYRRMNFLYYVSPDWTLENGGNFELWDAAVTKQHTVVAKFNRLLVMETTKTSWHSVSRVEVDRPRCCVSTYVFSPRSADETEYFHVTSFMGRPEQPTRRVLGRLDNALRQTASVVLNTGRGRNLVNRPDQD
ncbi:2OG-Fe(II) oxygenase [Trinickia sp. EG282A]|uniref:2OG-Fe(II) oxygenase n=1 Tax=Trinickia sp. EG282A TaxID=3237013 RepID=UPI0034D286DC